jgi:hypothetical protein
MNFSSRKDYSPKTPIAPSIGSFGSLTRFQSPCRLQGTDLGSLSDSAIWHTGHLPAHHPIDIGNHLSRCIDSGIYTNEKRMLEAVFLGCDVDHCGHVDVWVK